MNKLIISVLFAIVSVGAFGQKEKDLYEKAMIAAQDGNLEKGIKLMSKSIDLDASNAFAWYNRGIMKTMLNDYEAAFLDFEQTIKLAPDYKKAYLNRGTARKRLTDYEGAIDDYNYAISLDENYADAFYNRALVYEMLGEQKEACEDFHQAKDLGLEQAEKDAENCNEPSNSEKEIHYIIRLEETSSDETYGYSQDNPIKVGFGQKGGPGNQRAYLRLLRDESGSPIQYQRLGSCCPYESENGLLGMAMTDIYEITYKNKKGKEQQVNVYISFYDFEEPKIIKGFRTIQKP